MALPLAIAGIKGVLSSYKVWMYAGLLALGMLGAYVKGRESVYKENIGIVTEFVQEEREKAATANKQAQADAKALSELRSRAGEQLKDLDKASAYDSCMPTDEQLRILTEIATGERR